MLTFVFTLANLLQGMKVRLWCRCIFKYTGGRQGTQGKNVLKSEHKHSAWEGQVEVSGKMCQVPPGDGRDRKWPGARLGSLMPGHEHMGPFHTVGYSFPEGS